MLTKGPWKHSTHQKLAKIGKTSFLGPEDEPWLQSAKRIELPVISTVIASLRAFKNWL